MVVPSCGMASCARILGGLCVVLSTMPVEAQALKSGGIGDLHAALRSEDYPKGRTIADGILRDGSPTDKQTALLLYGRLLLGEGRLPESQKYLTQLRGAKLDENGQQLVKVYQAWLDALQGKQDAAIKSLQDILKAQAGVESTADAAEILARIHNSRGEADLASNAVKFGQQFLKYQGLKSAYLDALFGRRLEQGQEIGKDPAEILYRQADSLRLTGKFVESQALFERVYKEHPGSEWSHPAGFRIGECLLGSGRSALSSKHWEEFVKTSPAGPWRGHAHVALVDVALEETFDLGVAAKHVAAAANTLRAGVDEKAKKSWQACAYEIHLRGGIVALVEQQYAPAVEAFTAAKAAAAGNRESLAGIERLIAIANDKTPVVPEEVRGGQPSGLMLSLGAVHNLTSRFDRSMSLFSRVVGGKIRGSSPAQKAYATYGLAFALEQQQKLTDAKAGYLASLKAYPGGSWHDETLCRAAFLTQTLAEAASAKSAPQKGEPPKPPPKAVPTPEERAKQREQDRQARNDAERSRLRGRGEALPLWTQLIKLFATSPHVEPALYHAGILYLEADKPHDALRSWAFLVEHYPASPYAGEAQVRLVDLHLETFFDLPAAESHAAAALKWLAAAGAVAPKQSAPSQDAPGARPLRHAAYDIHIRAGLIAYLNQQTAEALAQFQTAQPLSPPREVVVVSGQIPTGVERLISAAKSGKKLAPEEVFAGDPKGKLCLQLVGLYYEVEDFERAIGLCNYVLDKVGKATREQRSWAYFMRGRSLHGQMLPLEGLDDFRRAADESQQASWRAKSLFYMANAVFNYERNTPGAIAIWQLIMRQFPGSAEAERAEYYIGFSLQSSARAAEARAAYETFLKAHPGSVYEKAIRTHHLPHLDKLEANAPLAPVKGKRS